MSGKLLFVAGMLLLAAVAVAAVAVSLSRPDGGAPTPGPAPGAEDEGRPDRIPPPLDSGRAATGEVAGRVVGTNDRPIAGALVALLAVSDGLPDRSRRVSIRLGSGGASGEMSFAQPGTERELATVTTGADGRFSFDASEPGPFTVRASLDGYATAVAEGVERGDRAVEIRLLRAGSVRGLVVEQGGAPVPGAVVRSGAASALAGRDGSFLLEAVPAGAEPRDIAATASGFEGAKASVRVVAAAVVDLDAPLTLESLPGISGRVFDPAGEPLKGVVVMGQQGFMGGGMGTTDEGGRYHLTDIEDGEVTLSFRHPRYLGKVVPAIRHSAGGRTIAPDVRLEPGGVIAGRIVGPDGGPVAGARAAAVKEVKQLDFRDLALMGGLGQDLPPSDAAGRFEVPGLATGSYTLVVEAKGFKPFRQDDLEVRVPETTRFDVRLEEGNVIAGRVVDGDGKGIAGASVAATEEYEASDFREMMLRGSQERSATTDPDGFFELRGFGEGKARVTVSAEGFATLSEGGVEIGARDLSFRLTRTGSVRGRVVAAESGEALAGVSVWAGGESAEGATTDEDGRFLIRNVPAGTHDVGADYPARAPASVSGVVVREGEETAGVELRLDRGEVLRGIVVRRIDGSPIAGATVALSGEVHRTSTTDEQGRFAVVGLVAGVYAQSVTAEGFAGEEGEGLAVPATGEIRIELSLGGTVKGVVRDGVGKPLAGQMVLLGAGMEFGENFSQTGSDGAFAFEHIRPGRYTVMVMKMDASGGGSGFGFDANSKSVTVEEGGEAWVEFGGETEPKKATVTGRLMSRGKPLGSRMLMLMKVGGSEGGVVGLMSSMKMVNTDGEGRFTVADLEPGTYRVLTGDTGQNMQGGLTLEVNEAGEIERDIVLPEGRVEGTVTGSDGKPIADVKVTLVDPAHAAVPAQSFDDLLAMMLAQSTTGEDGTFVMENVRVGTVMVQVGAEGHATRIMDGVQISGESSAPIRIALSRGAEVTIRTRSDQGQPVPNVPLILLDGAGRRILFGDDLSISTDSTGIATLRLMGGDYRVIAQRAPFALSERKFRVDRDATVDVALAPGGSVSVSVTRGGRLVENALVRFFRDDGSEVVQHVTEMEMMGEMAPRRTQSDGTLVRAELPAGNLRVVAVAEDGGKGEGTVRIVVGTVAGLAVEVD